MKDLTIIKLGGSVITDKDSGKKIFRKKVVERLVGEIKTAKDRSNFKLILVHGNGSFGHPEAKAYRVAQGYLGPESKKGLALTKRWVLKLSLLLWEELEKVDLISSLVEPSAVIKASLGRIKNFDTGFIEFLLNKNITPILSGDVVPDSIMGFSIISGDQIAAFLARKLGADKVIFVSDVDGIFDNDPKIYKDAKIVPKINARNYKKIIRRMQIRNGDDISGEMKGKILAIKRDLEGVRVLLTNGNKPGNLLRSLINSNGRNTGTVIKF